MRDRAKRVCYGILYGMSAFGLSQALADQGVGSAAAAQALIDSFLSRFPGVRAFMQARLAAAQREGAVTTLAGRVRPIAGLTSPRPNERAAAERKVVNSIIQVAVHTTQHACGVRGCALLHARHACTVHNGVCHSCFDACTQPGASCCSCRAALPTSSSWP